MTPTFRATPQAVSTSLIPDWRAVSKAIPPDFRCDGASDPTILYLLSLTSFLPWSKRASVAVNEAGRIHDFGYGPARLPGSGFDHYGKAAWDEMYRQCLIDKGHPVIANTHWRGVTWFGGRAWRANWRKMQIWGWFTYASFLADVDKSVEPMGML